MVRAIRLEQPELPKQVRGETDDDYILFIDWIAYKRENRLSNYKTFAAYYYSCDHNEQFTSKNSCYDAIRGKATRNRWQKRKAKYFLEERKLREKYYAATQNKSFKERIQRQDIVDKKIYRLSLKILMGTELAINGSNLSLASTTPDDTGMSERDRALAAFNWTDESYKPASPEKLQRVLKGAGSTVRDVYESVAGHDLLAAKKAAEDIAREIQKQTKVADPELAGTELDYRQAIADEEE